MVHVNLQLLLKYNLKRCTIAVLRVITLFETLEREHKLFNNVLLHN